LEDTAELSSLSEGEDGLLQSGKELSDGSAAALIIIWRKTYTLVEYD
jgi:hypothetical protein